MLSPVKHRKYTVQHCRYHKKVFIFLSTECNYHISLIQ